MIPFVPDIHNGCVSVFRSKKYINDSIDLGDGVWGKMKRNC